jgi:hypothetical protein
MKKVKDLYEKDLYKFYLGEYDEISTASLMRIMKEGGAYEYANNDDHSRLTAASIVIERLTKSNLEMMDVVAHFSHLREYIDPIRAELQNAGPNND